MESYLVRVWRPSPGTAQPPPALRGTVVDLTAHAEITFGDAASLLAILTRGEPCIVTTDAATSDVGGRR